MAPVMNSTSEVEKYLKSLKGKSVDASIDSLISLFKRRQIAGSEPCAMATAHILLQVVAKTKFRDVDHMLETVRQVGCKLVAAQPKELVVANIVRRVLGLIRDEASEQRNEGTDDDASPEEPFPPAADAPEPSEAPSTKYDGSTDYLHSGPRHVRLGALMSVGSFPASKTLLSLLEASPPGHPSLSPLAKDSGTSTPRLGHQNARISAIRAEIIDGIEEIKDEISQVDDQIASSADVQIRPLDYVLVYQPSHTVQKFLLRAATKRRFTVVIAVDPRLASSPREVPGEVPFASFRKKLQAAGVASMNIMNIGQAAHMPRISKVVLSARCVLANGGVVTDAGAGHVARAAKEKGCPVIVLSGVYELSPESSMEEDELVEWGGAMGHAGFSDGLFVKGAQLQGAVTELIQPELVDSYITNLGIHSRNHLTTIVADHYKAEDVDFQLWGDAER
ncbi:translation initiation factor eIF-2B subunit beta [Sodiomyces alkalinus F11]|uniref:Translation initiation factor eIF2B subunit beta n=1 Tax=Sodiomyces alkalinus (strain CBS 110278 / VKM F-3762 / F11) TaxID=1314773 RepID=A0A3N2Q418_SODAK|nr:translation initiation factor eIF-2B subunit beta [Sodiomyces alkalinus F11]ROT41499.1 translation initiation factor eIF-2B subunit beta [Sodiomyces alkalinus F11]